MCIVTLRNYILPKLLHTQEQSCNCSLFIVGSKRYLISRCVSYFLCDKQVFVMNGKCHTTNYLYEVDEDFNLQKVKPLFNPYKDQVDARYNGLEDVRIVSWNDSIYFLCTKVLGNTDTATMCMGSFSKKDLDITGIKEIRTNQPKEKNWAPIQTEPFNCIYSHGPLIKINLQTGEQHKINDGIAGTRGSSSLVEYDSGSYIALVHTNSDAHVYTHRLVKYDRQFHIIGVSQPFTFFGAKVEFCTTLKVTSDGIILIPSVYDGISYVFKIPTNLVDALFADQLDKTSVDPNLYNTLFLDAISNGVYEVAATIACMATDPKIVAQSVIYNYNSSKFDPHNRYHRQSLLISRFGAIKKSPEEK